MCDVSSISSNRAKYHTRISTPDLYPGVPYGVRVVRKSCKEMFIAECESFELDCLHDCQYIASTCTCVVKDMHRTDTTLNCHDPCTACGTCVVSSLHGAIRIASDEAEERETNAARPAAGSDGLGRRCVVVDGGVGVRRVFGGLAVSCR